MNSSADRKGACHDDLGSEPGQRPLHVLVSSSPASDSYTTTGAAVYKSEARLHGPGSGRWEKKVLKSAAGVDQPGAKCVDAGQVGR